MTNYERLEVLKALKHHVSDEVILEECDITPEQLYQIKIEFERDFKDETD